MFYHIFRPQMNGQLSAGPMIRLRKKILFFTFSDFLFDYKFRLKDIFLPVCYRYVGNPKTRFRFGIKKKIQTIILPLDKSPDEMFRGFNDNVKRGIKKAEAAGVQCVFHKDVKSFISFYNEFAKSRGVHGFDESDIPFLTDEPWTFCNAVLDGEVLVSHSYVLDKEKGIVRLMYGGSVRLDGKHVPREIGNATKLLYFNNIKHFSEQGFKHFDFGGWDGIEGLLALKLSFGARVTDTTNFFSYSYFLKDQLKSLAKTLKGKK
jgi:hypothetical protein